MRLLCWLIILGSLLAGCDDVERQTLTFALTSGKRGVRTNFLLPSMPLTAAVAGGDVDGDGVDDALVVAADGQNRALVFSRVFSDPAAAKWDLGASPPIPEAYGLAAMIPGDLNGDGYADSIVASGENAGDTPILRSLNVYLGGPDGPSSGPTSKIQIAAGANVTSIAVAGDLNGDERADLILGGPDCVANTGRLLVLYGGSDQLSEVSSEEMMNVGAGAGAAVAPAGDLDGDGFGDVLVTANGCGGPARVHLLRGSRDGLIAVPAWTALSPDATRAFGSSISGVGDIDGDGAPDIAIGAGGRTAETPGVIYVYFGEDNSLAETSTLLIEAPNGEPRFGRSVVGLGDVNGDGLGDFGATTRFGNGRGYIYTGRLRELGGPPAAPRALIQPDAGDCLLDALTRLGDVDGDGLPEVGQALMNDRGIAIKVVGIRAAGPAPDAEWLSHPTDQRDARLGTSVATAGDVDGDGFTDLLAGAPRWDGQAENEGSAYLFRGSATGLHSEPAWSAAPTGQLGAEFGHSMAACDVNGDGFSDVVIAARSWDGEQPNIGRAFAFLGSRTGLSEVPDWEVSPTSLRGAHFGAVVTVAGDVNGDGFCDIAISADNWNGEAAAEGRVYVFHGSRAGLATEPAVALDSSDQELANFGQGLSGAGDVNGDGYDDLLVGADDWTGEASAEGRAYLFAGGPDGVAVEPIWTADPTDNDGAGYGEPVAAAGDVNGDGYADFLVGAFGYGQGAGRAYLYYGGPSGPLPEPWLAGDANVAMAALGAGLAAGDVNGDGVGDAVVGTRTGVSEVSWRAAVYLGQSTGLRAEPERLLSSTGYNTDVAAALTVADFNGDGFGDVIAGATRFAGEVPGEGGVFGYYGGDGGRGVARGLGQFNVTNRERIGAGGVADGDVMLEMRINPESPYGGLYRVEFEITAAAAFVGEDLRLSAPVVRGDVATVTLQELAPGAYQWRARLVYPAGLGHGQWVGFDLNNVEMPDFIVEPLSPRGGSDGDASSSDARSFYGCRATQGGDAVTLALMLCALVLLQRKCRRVRRV